MLPVEMIKEICVNVNLRETFQGNVHFCTIHLCFVVSK